MLNNQSKIQLKLFQRKQLKTAESTSDFICHKVAIKLQKLQKYHHKSFQRHLNMKQIRKERYISLEQRQQI